MPAADWSLTATAFEVNVDSFLHDVNQFNEPAPAGKITVRARFRAEYSGDGTGSPSSIRINLVGTSGTTYGESGPCCSGEIDALEDQAETFAGGAVEGFIYYQMTPDDAAGKVLAFAPNVTYTDVPGGVGLFAVN